MTSFFHGVPLRARQKMSNKPSGKSERSVLSELFYERETEYYGMTPYALLDRIGSMIVDRYFVALNELQSDLLPNSCPFLSETQIAAALTQWSLLVEGTIDKNFELFETYIMKNILALPSDFPIDKFLDSNDEEQNGQKREAASQEDLKVLEDKMEQISKRLENASLKNKRLKGELELLNLQETSLEHFESHLTCIKGLLQQYKIESFERSMSTFANELSALKYMVTETLAAGSNYLFAKYDSVTNESTSAAAEINNDTTIPATTNNSDNSSSAYNRILTEMAGLSAAQTVEQIETRRREISSELTEKTKISTISDFEKFRMAIQKLNNKTVSV